MELLKELYKTYSPSGKEKGMRKFLIRWIKENCPTAHIQDDEKGNLYITKGRSETYPCLVAHMDQVQKIHSKDFEVLDAEGVLCGYSRKNKRHEGLGADDKNGLWVIINLLHSEPILKVALFVQEERVGDNAGCRGARACDLSFFNDVKFVLECDRKGSSDVVSIGKDELVLCHQDFIPQGILRRYGYEMVKGGKTDVVELKMRGLQIPVCNISCGYYDAHKNSEYTLFPELQNCLSFVRGVLKSI